MGNDGKPRFLSNNAGGILGGISTGQPIVVRFAVKPTSSILTPRKTVDRYGNETEVSTKGRHDPCVGIRAVPIGEAMVACVIADHYLRQRAQVGETPAWPFKKPVGVKGVSVLESHERVEAAVAAFARGEIIVVTDDDDRENEGDLFVAASLCTPEKMAFIIRNTSGIVCAPLSGDEARRLRLDPMVTSNDAPLGTAFTITVDVRHGLTTGISAEERTNTVRALANGNSGAADFVRPGHVFPLVAKDGGVLMRSGHTEACIDLCRLAGLPPVGVLSELMNDDGTVMRGPGVAAFAQRHKLTQISIADIISYRQAREKLVKRVGEFPVKSEIGTLNGYAYVTPFDAVHHMAVVHGKIGDGKNVLARLHRADIIRDVFGGANPVHSRAAAAEGGGPRRHRHPARWRGGCADPGDSVQRPELRSRPHQAMARGRARRADPQGPRHFLDPPADLGQAHLCGLGWLRHRNHRHRNRRLTLPFPRFASVPPLPRIGQGGVACGGVSRSLPSSRLLPWQRSPGLALPRPTIRRRWRNAATQRRSRSTPRWCSRSTSPTRWTPKSRRCSAKAIWRR